MGANDFFILYKEREDSQHFPISAANLKDPDFKSVILGPLTTPRNIKVSSEFFNQ
jgi:hypothetical protein